MQFPIKKTPHSNLSKAFFTEGVYFNPGCTL